MENVVGRVEAFPEFFEFAYDSDKRVKWVLNSISNSKIYAFCRLQIVSFAYVSR